MSTPTELSVVLPHIFGAKFTGDLEVNFSKSSLEIKSKKSNCVIENDTLRIQLAESQEVIDLSAKSYIVTVKDGVAVSFKENEKKTKAPSTKPQRSGSSSTSSRFPSFA